MSDWTLWQSGQFVMDGEPVHAVVTEVDTPPEGYDPGATFEVEVCHHGGGGGVRLYYRTTLELAMNCAELRAREATLAPIDLSQRPVHKPRKVIR